MNRGHEQVRLAGGREAVPRAGGGDDEVAGPSGALVVTDPERPLALVDEKQLGVRVAVQARPAPGRRVDEDQADPDVAVVGADELAGDPAESGAGRAAAAPIRGCFHATRERLGWRAARVAWPTTGHHRATFRRSVAL